MSKKNKSQSMVRVFLTGFMMGAADIVPGVSGGTIAFIFGIYEKLVETIKVLSGEFLRTALKFELKKAWQMIPFAFILPLGLGLLTAVVGLSSILEHAFDTYPEYIWSYFFGLVLVSIWIVAQRIQDWNTRVKLSIGAGAVFAFLLVGITPVNTAATLPAFFVSGMVAICAMILPGVSGSFLLVMMGKYQQILSAVNNREYLVLAAVGLGAVVGLAVFSRVLKFLFDRYHDTVVAVLLGFMVGSLRKIWPWKETLETYLDSDGVEQSLRERAIMPELSGELLVSLALCAAGIATILYLHRLQEQAHLPEEL